MTHPENSDQSKCSDCGSHTTYFDKTKCGIYPHWRYDSSGKQICGKCYTRASWKKRIPVGVSCDFCKTTEPTKTKYGTPKWVRNRSREGGYLCRSFYNTQRDTGIIFSPQRKKNISIGIRRALEAGSIMGPKIYAIDETVFDTINEHSAYWVGYLMADGKYTLVKQEIHESHLLQIHNRLQRMQTCKICYQKFSSLRKVKQHKRSEHAN